MSNLAQQLLTPFTPSDATSLRPSYTPSPLGRGTLDPTQTAAITIDSSALPPIPPTAAEKRKATENGIRSRSYHGKAVKQHANGYTVTRPTVCGFTTPANSAKKLRTIAGSDETLQQSLVSQPHAPIPPLSDSQWEELLKEEDLGWRCFQTDTVDALLEGKDAVVLARTGLGKSMLWVIPFMRVQKRIVVVGFPLKALGPLQQLELNRFNLRSIVASGSHPSIELLRQILTTEFDVLLATYEFLAFEGFTTLLKNEGFANRILYMALDEVHYLVQDESFRGVMLAFDKLRSVTKRHIPLLALTATASPPWIRKISLRLGIDLDDPRRTFFRNYGNRRPEIRSWVGPVSKGHQDLAVVVPMDISCLVDIPQTLIYVDNRSLGMRILYYLQDRLKTALGDGLGVGDITGIRIVHSDLEDETLSQNYADFASGVMRVMVATEVYGAGANPPNVRRVIQWRIGPSMSYEQLVQRRGRGARSGGTASFYFFAESTSFEKSRESAESSGVNTGIFNLLNLGPRECIEDLETLLFDNPEAAGTLDLNLCTCGGCYTYQQIPCSSFCCDHSFRPPLDANPSADRTGRNSGWVRMTVEQKRVSCEEVETRTKEERNAREGKRTEMEIDPSSETRRVGRVQKASGAAGFPALQPAL